MEIKMVITIEIHINIYLAHQKITAQKLMSRMIHHSSNQLDLTRLCYPYLRNQNV